MKIKKLILLVGIVLFFIVISTSVFAIHDPSLVYCEEMGYKIKINRTELGEYGVCIIEENVTEYDAWDFFKAIVGREYSFCLKNGYDIETVTDGKNLYSPHYAVCILKNKISNISEITIKDSSNEVRISMIELMKLDEKIANKGLDLDIKSGEVIENKDILEIKNMDSLSSSFDWRNYNGHNWMTPVKDQRCGNCWAYSANGGFEAMIKISRNDPNFDVDLSEQYLVSCSGAGNCINGGFRDDALEYIKNNGVTDDPCFDDSGTDEPCSNRCPTWDKRLWKIDSLPINTYGYVSDELIKNFLINGPLPASMYYAGSWDSNNIYRCDEDSPDYPHSGHAIVIVGYNDTGGYWIIKNSWGTSYPHHDEGYFKLGYGECGIGSRGISSIQLFSPLKEEIKASDIEVNTGSITGALSDTFYNDGDYITLSESCFLGCDGLDVIFKSPTTTLSNTTSIDLIAKHKARWEGGFNLLFWDENIHQWNSLGNIPYAIWPFSGEWYLMKYKICNSKIECYNYLSSENIIINYSHPSCVLCDQDFVDIDWLYIEAILESETYCSAFTLNGGLDYIQRVAINENEKKSGTTNYSDFTDTVLTTLNKGSTYTLYVDGYAISPRNEYVKAWIDFNNDKNFSEDEEIDLGNFVINGIHTFSKTFIVPNDAVESEVRMRVYLKYSTPSSPCEIAGWGEVEDYTINIVNDTTAPSVWVSSYGAGYVQAGDTVIIRLNSYDGSGTSSVFAYIESPDENLLEIVQLFDDGMHFDNSANDGIFGNSWTTHLDEKDYFIDFSSTDIHGNSVLENNLDKFTTIPFNINSTILLISPYGTSYIEYYQNSLDSNNYSYDFWDFDLRGEIDNNTINSFELCIWSNPFGAPTINQQIVLNQFLDNGGKLFISGQDIGYYVNGTDFYNNYLHADFVQDNTNIYVLDGILGDIITDGISIYITGTDSASNQYWPSEIKAINGAIPIFVYNSMAPLPPGPSPQPVTSISALDKLDKETVSSTGIELDGTAALRVDTGTYKVIYFAFGFEAINGTDNRNLIMKRVVDWLIDLTPPQITINNPKNNSIIYTDSTILEVLINKNGTCQYSLDFGEYSDFSTLEIIDILTGESAKIATSEVELTPWYNPQWVKGIFIENDLPNLLSSGTYSITNGNYPYKQYLYIAGENTNSNPVKLVFERPITEDSPRIAFKIPGSSALWTYKLTFLTPVSLSGVTDTNSLRNLIQNTKIKIFGKDYTVTNATYGSSSTPIGDITILGKGDTETIKISSSGVIRKGTLIIPELTAEIVQSSSYWPLLKITHTPTIDNWLNTGEKITDPFSKNFDISFDSFHPEFNDTINRQNISFSPSGYNMLLTYENAADVEKQMYTLYTTDGTTWKWASAPITLTGTDNFWRDVVFDEGSNISAIDQDYFIIQGGNFSHVMQFTSLISPENLLVFTDEEGNIIEVTYYDNQADLIIDGYIHKVYIVDFEKKIINIDLNNNTYIATRPYSSYYYTGNDLGKEYSYLIPKLIMSGQGGLYFYRGNNTVTATSSGTLAQIGMYGFNITTGNVYVFTAMGWESIGAITNSAVNYIFGSSLDGYVDLIVNCDTSWNCNVGLGTETIGMQTSPGFVLVEEAQQGGIIHNWLYLPVKWDATNVRTYIGTTLYSDDNNYADIAVLGTTTQYKGMTTYGTLTDHLSSFLGGSATISYPDTFSYGNIYITSTYWKNILNFSQIIDNLSDGVHEIDVKCKNIYDIENSTKAIFTIDACTPNWVLNDTWGECQSNDFQYKNYYDSNNCNEPETKPPDLNQSCDYCTPDWYCSNYGDCQPDDKKYCNSVNDNNNCYAQTSLPSDQYSGDYSEFESVACNYCTPSWILDDNPCEPDDMKLITYTDVNNCNETEDLPENNGTYVPCDYCVPNWILNDTWSECQKGDIQFKNYYDVNNCNETEDKPEDINQSCEYIPEHTTFEAIVNITENQTTLVEAINETNTSIELVSKENVTNAGINISKYVENPKSSFGVFELDKFISIEVSSEINETLLWAIIKIHYADDELNGIDENSLRIYYYNSTSDTWIPYDPPNGGVNTTGNYVWANTTHFSYYGSGGLLKEGESCDSNSECSSGHCVHNICRASSTYCGDGFCDSGEDCSSCSADCGICYSPPPGGGGGGGFVPPTCKENWTCSEWSECIAGTQTRICTDQNKCGTTKNKPDESQSCEGVKTPIETPIEEAEIEEITPEEIPSANQTGEAVAPTGFFLGISTDILLIGIVAGAAVALVIIFAVLRKRRRKK